MSTKAINLADLGITQEQVLDRVVEKLVDGLLNEDIGGNLEARVRRKLEEHINKAVADLGEKHVLPRIAEQVESITLQATNQWGEKKGETLTFREYLVQRADAYMREQVNYEGKSRQDDHWNSSNWKAANTRVALLVEKHLAYNIEHAMKQALANVNSSIAAGLNEAVKLKIAEALAGLETTVKVKR